MIRIIIICICMLFLLSCGKSFYPEDTYPLEVCIKDNKVIIMQVSSWHTWVTRGNLYLKCYDNGKLIYSGEIIYAKRK